MNKQIQRRHAQEICTQTGLKLATCLDLLQNGWTYVTGYNQSSRWLSPLESLGVDRDD